MLEIDVHEIRGKCPVYRMGDKMVIDGPEIVLKRTDTLCVHALSTLLHYAALDEGADPVKLGLTKLGQREFAFMQCVDLGELYTGGGTVVPVSQGFATIE